MELGLRFELSNNFINSYFTKMVLYGNSINRNERPDDERRASLVQALLY